MQMNLNARQQMAYNKILRNRKVGASKKYKGKYYKKPKLDKSLVQTL